jgi:dTDP-4-dehydrorhamnose reductase
VVGRTELDVTDEDAVHRTIRALRPDTIIQCAAYTRVDDAESHEDTAHHVNGLGTRYAAEAAAEVGARFVYPSTDYVFDGGSATPYRPEDPPHPINAYGRTKLAGEAFARLAPDHLIIRMSWLYGPGGRNFVRTVSERLAHGETLRVVNDQTGRPTWTVDAAATIMQLIDAAAGSVVYHVANSGAATWFDVAMEIASRLGVRERVEPCSSSEYPMAAARPRYSVLDCRHTEAVCGPARDWRVALAEAIRGRAY